MKIVSDFDGVWTDPSAEAAVILEVIVAEVAGACGLAEDAVAAHVQSLLPPLLACADQCGMRLQDELTAFADEDHFIRNSAICHALANDSGAMSVGSPELRATLQEGVERLGGPEELARATYERGSQQALEADHLRVNDEARELLEQLHEADVELVLVSNSSTAKIERYFENGGISLQAMGIRVRGHAGKFVLETPPEPPGGERDITLAGRQVRVDRGRYHLLLREEKPDLVIGDVVSLDLALPFALRQQDRAAGGGSLAGLRLALKENHYTPAWALDAVRTDPLDCAVPELTGLLSLV